MTSHGFGKVEVKAIDGSGQEPSPKIVKEFAKEISKKAGVVRTHTQKKAKGSWKDSHIIFEYGHISTDFEEEYPNGHTQFFDEIKAIKLPKPPKPPKWQLRDLEHWTIEVDIP